MSRGGALVVLGVLVALFVLGLDQVFAEPMIPLPIARLSAVVLSGVAIGVLLEALDPKR